MRVTRKYLRRALSAPASSLLLAGAVAACGSQSQPLSSQSLKQSNQFKTAYAQNLRFCEHSPGADRAQCKTRMTSLTLRVLRANATESTVPPTGTVPITPGIPLHGIVSHIAPPCRYSQSFASQNLWIGKVHGHSADVFAGATFKAEPNGRPITPLRLNRSAVLVEMFGAADNDCGDAHAFKVIDAPQGSAILKFIAVRGHNLIAVGAHGQKYDFSTQSLTFGS